MYDIIDAHELLGHPLAPSFPSPHRSPSSSLPQSVPPPSHRRRTARPLAPLTLALLDRQRRTAPSARP